MSTSNLEERLARIERELDGLKHEVYAKNAEAKTWRRTVGMLPDDELSRSAERLGREWREQANVECSEWSS